MPHMQQENVADYQYFHLFINNLILITFCMKVLKAK
jgi:hypothetical protein